MSKDIKTPIQKNYAIRKWVGVPVSGLASFVVYKFVLIDFFVKFNWISKGWAIFIAIIIFMAGFGYWIEQSNKSQFYETHKDGMKINKS